MVVRKEHLIAVVLILALVVAYFAQKSQNSAALNEQRLNLVQGCKRTSARTAIIAAWTMDAARTRAASPKRADQLAGKRYEGYARSIIATIPATPAHKGDVVLADVEQIENPRTGLLDYKLTEKAAVLQAAGCEFAYPRQ